MSIFHPTEITGKVEAIMVNPSDELQEAAVHLDEVEASLTGFAGEAHGGATRPACVRVKKQYPADVELRNTRQISIVSVEELAQIAAGMGLPGPIDPAWLGANLMLSGIPELTKVPPSSRLIFESGAGIVVDCENGPCRGPANMIDRHYPGQGKMFVKNALNKRGLVAWVERAGTLRQGMGCRLHIPAPHIYAPLAAASTG